MSYLVSVFTYLNLFCFIHTFQIYPYRTIISLNQVTPNLCLRHYRNRNVVMKGNEILNNANSQSYKIKNSPVIARLSPDKIGLIRWIEDSGGSFQVNIENNKLTGGWSLCSSCDVKRGEIIASVPKSICIFSNVEQQRQFSDTNVVTASGSKTSIVNNNLKCHLLDSTQSLMMSLNNEKQWRTRLAIALLSERFRSNSVYKMYIQNLPCEIRGLPIFYTSEEFEMIQDLALTQQSRERCRFLSEFVQQVLTPISHITTSTQHPFVFQKVDLNSFGWAFGAVSSRAIRSFDDSSASSSESGGPALVPGIDLLSHDPIHPNCEIIITPENYFLISTKDIRKHEELTVSYGPLSNEELLIDYGFTVNNNPHNTVKIKCDTSLINTARVAMNQGTYMNENFSIKNKYENVHYLRCTTGSSLSTNMSPRSLSLLTAATAGSATSATVSSNNKVNKKPFPMEIINGLLGKESTAYGEQWLHAWQRQWLSVLQLVGDAPRVTKAVAITGPKPAKSSHNRDEENTDSTTTSKTGATSATLSSTSNASLSQIDGKLFAMFRILYAKREAELLQHGYNPFLLQSPSSVLSLDNEKEVIKSILGIISIVLFQYETELHTDLEMLWKNDRHHIPSTSSDISSRSSSGGSDRFNMKASKGGSRGVYRDTITEVQTFLRNLLYSNPTDSSGSDVTSKEQLLQRQIQKVRVNAGKIIDEFELNLINEVNNVNTPSPSSTATDGGNRDAGDGENRANSSNSGRGNPSTVTSASSDKLTHNMQEILKYRIRKKSILMDLVYTLISHYERLVAATATDSSDVSVAAAQSLLPSEDRGDRKAKIKDLLDEVSE